MFPEVAATFQKQLASLYEGLQMLVHPSPASLGQLDPATLKVVFEFLHFLVHRHFGMLLHLSQARGVECFVFALALISSGLQSTASCALLNSIDCVSQNTFITHSLIFLG